MKNDLIRLEEVTKYYTSSGGVGLGLHKVNLSFNLGEFVVITGSSGSGKTTLLNVITGMDTYEEGTIFVEGEDTTYFGSADYEEFRRKYISFIFQNYNLVDSFTAYQNVELALIARGIPKKERKKQVIEMLKQVGLEKRINHRVTRLSGGEKQRVSIARALCSDAPIIACDEITGNLDMATSIEIIKLLKRLSKGKLVLLVSHDVNEALDYATRVVVMHDGSVDKDYFVNQDNEELEKEEQTEKDVVRKLNKVSFSDTIGLAVKTLISTPSKFIFLLTIAMFFTLFLFVGVMTYHYMVDVSYLILEEETKADSTSYNNRIIVRKDDDSVFTNEEINSFYEYKNVSAVISNDIFFDTHIYYAFDDEVSEQLYSNIILPAGTLKFSDLRYGRLPKNEKEVVLVGSKDFLRKTVYLAIDGDEAPRECTVVGLLPQSSIGAVYVHDDIIPSIVNRLEMNKLEFYFKYIPENRDLAQLTSRQYDWYVDETLDDTQLRVEWHISSNVSEPAPPVINYFEGMPTDIYFISNNTTLDFEDMDIDFYTYRYPQEENKTLTGKEELLIICDKTSRRNEFSSSINCYLSPANYEKVMNFNLQNFQISVLTDNETNVRKVTNRIEQGSYYCSAKALIVNENQVLLATVLEVVVVVAVIVIALGLSLIVYSIIKNILNSQHKAFLIMRSLGIDGNRISVQVYIELAFTLLVNFVIAFVLWAVFKFRNFGGFFASMHKSTFGNVILIFAVSIVVFAVLGFKYSSSVIKSSIVNKEME